MIDDVKDLSRVEKAKQLARKEFTNYLGKTFIAVIVASVAVTVFALFIVNRFLNAFTAERALITTGLFVSSLVIFLLLQIGVYKYTKQNGSSIRDFWLTTIMTIITFIATMAACTLLDNVYAMPIAIATLVLIELIDRRTATLATAVLCVLMMVFFLFSDGTKVFDIPVVLSAIVCNCMCAVLINFLEHKHYSRLKFLIAAMLTPLAMQPLVVTLTLAHSDISITILWNVVWCYGANVAAALVFMPLVAIFEGMFNIADDFRLNELCNLSNPLLKRLASEAPGTFNHSLVVGNLAEACASAIGENPNMARCAAYYHDIGKLKAPIYFSENQSSYNPHDELIPEVSVSMITSHTLFGEILAKQNRLPKEIVAICREHHGTSPVGYFYRKALTLKEEGDLAVDKYTYAGPKPQTKIAAIIMVADTIEAAMRAYMPDTREEYEARINKLVDEKLELRQFDECPITMGDIAIIKQTIIEVLPSIHHSRINYDKKRKSSK
ncbi:MAG: HDIG domain-containing protein [Clostridia bacterium]|nr:HDIG domain-containing protein [Clostridia bacterium]